VYISRVNLLSRLSALFIATALIYGCGGGGGAKSTTTSKSQRPPFAQEPVCNEIAQSHVAIWPNRSGPNTLGIIVPESSIDRPGDAGILCHTNCLISSRSVQPFASGQGQLTPSQVATAYGLPSPNNLGSGAIAVVDAYNYPNALDDFNKFSSTYSLPTESSSQVTSPSNKALQVVYATGSKPTNDASWSLEMAVDIEWAHAMAPNAKIYLVEAKSTALGDLAAAVNIAKALPGDREVSTSFGATENG